MARKRTPSKAHTSGAETAVGVRHTQQPEGAKQPLLRGGSREVEPRYVIHTTSSCLTRKQLQSKHDTCHGSSAVTHDGSSLALWKGLNPAAPRLPLRLDAACRSPLVRVFHDTCQHVFGSAEISRRAREIRANAAVCELPSVPWCRTTLPPSYFCLSSRGRP